MSGDSDIVRLVIDVHGDNDPIEGELIEPFDRATPFRGWLSLAALIESARKADGPDDAAVTRTPP